jgi:biotin transport system substrate-specific component
VGILPLVVRTGEQGGAWAREVGGVGGGAAIMAFASQISLPWAPVPLTFQCFAVVLCGLMLGATRGALAQLSYLAAGAAGMPVFAGGRAGVVHLVGPTAGYLLAFPLAAMVVGTFARHRVRFGGALAAGLLGNGLVLLLGWLWLSALQMNFASGWRSGVLPFLSGAVAQAVLSAGAYRATVAVAPAPPESR